MKGYTAYHRDRKDGRTHGGVVCYPENSIPFIEQWSDLDSSDLETLFITIRPKHMPHDFSQITFCLVYHPPKSDGWAMSGHLVEGISLV